MAASRPHLAIVTGANRGIGFEVCRQLNQRGVQVMMTYRDANAAQGNIAKLKELSVTTPNKASVHFHELDVSSEKSIRTFTHHIFNHFRDSKLILIHNAGVYLDRWNKSNFDISMKTHVHGPVQLTSELLPLMKSNHYGKIINVTTGYGKLKYLSPKYKDVLDQPWESEGAVNESTWNYVTEKVEFDADDIMSTEYKPTYKVSKATMNVWTRVFAQTLKNNKLDKFISVNAVDPGWVQTEMGGEGAPEPVEAGADTIVWLATTEADPPVTGKWFFKRQELKSW